MQAKELSWQIQQPNYFISYSILPVEPTIEQISFHYTIYYLLNGSLNLFINDSSTPVLEKQFIFICPRKPYSIRNLKGTLLTIKIKHEFVSELATRLGLDWRVGEIFFLELISINKELISISEHLIFEAKTCSIGYKIILDTLITQLVINLLRNYLRLRHNPQIEISRVGLVDRRLRRAIEYIHTHYNQELALSEMAQAAFLSEYHFAHLFKKLTGLTPNNYLIAVRVEQAKKLLIETDLSIVNISLSVGYSSQSHFTKVFRTITGLTPLKYRESFLNK
jgi:AraC family transcriptional regulator